MVSNQSSLTSSAAAMADPINSIELQIEFNDITLEIVQYVEQHRGRRDCLAPCVILLLSYSKGKFLVRNQSSEHE